MTGLNRFQAAYRPWICGVRGTCAVGFVAAVFFGIPRTALADKPAVNFNRDIRPILSNKCFQCHGPDSAAREADLRLDREEDAKADRGGYFAIVPGDLDESELVRRITSEEASERMPPEEADKELTAKEIDLLQRWVREDAKWSLAWSYVPPKRHAVPKVQDSSWPLNEIDHFLLARLEAEGLKPSPQADKTMLIRRLSIDLTGLPPTPEEVDAFLNDDSPDAYERLVDRLLESPHYGERMAVYWLDLVRYADSVGYHGDQEQNISPYRDYVIEALNANVPFDQFTREQLAGDLLPEPTTEQTIATGYNRVLQTSHEGGVQPKEYLAIYGADRVRNLSNVWMGATMGCAQCHDHKFDPYTTKDFYSMQAFFADVDEAKHFKRGTNANPTARPPELELPTEQQKTQIAELENRIKRLKRQLGEPSRRSVAKVARRDTVTNTSGAANNDGNRDVDDNDNEEQDVDDDDSVPDDDKGNAKDKDAKKGRDSRDPQKRALRQELKEHQKELLVARAAVPKTMITVSIEPRTTRILPRGNWLDDSGEVVLPAVPEFLGPLEVGDRRATRLDLAHWLTDAQHGGGLTARVMANRFWYLLFGRGLAAVLDDFGGQGEAPSHPELLDSLAVEFVDSGWDIKHMMKLIAMSRAYRQSSRETPPLRQRDPLNTLFARQARFRFPAEAVRDSTLLISGLLIDKQGGASVKPYQPAGYYRHLNFPEREYEAHLDQRQWRRGVYVHWQRQYLHPMLKAFDAPSREECTAQRPRSNTPLAALVLLNDPTFVEASRSFAARIIQEGGSTADERFDFAFRQAVSRLPTEKEREVLSKLLEQSREDYTSHRKAAHQLLSVGVKPVPQNIDRSELAAWTIIARSILSLQEAVTRS